MIDHLVYAVPDLDKAVDEFEARTRIRPVLGGKHVGRGTHNALVALGNQSYLEIIAPDPDQTAVQGSRPFGLDSLASPRLVTWAASTKNLDQAVRSAKLAGFDPGPIVAMSRQRPDGVVLRWRLTLRAGFDDAPLPFLIEWSEGNHPADSAPKGCHLLSLRGQHPKPEPIVRILEALGERIDLTHGSPAALIAQIESPRGRFELR